MKMFITILFTLFISSGILGETPTKRCKRLLCMVETNLVRNVIPNEINTDLCTHLVYDHARLEGNILKNIHTFELNGNKKIGLYGKFNALKRQYPKLVTILRAATPWDEGFKPFSKMAATAKSREEFITTTITFLRRHNFDGLDIVWYFPGRFTGNKDDVYRAADLIKETFEAFENESKATRRPRLLLTMTVHPWKTGAYDIPILTKYTDMVNIIGFSMSGPWQSELYHHSTINDIKLCMYFWGSIGIPLEKLNIGFAFFGIYGHVANKTNPNPGGKVVDVGRDAFYTPASKGSLHYPEICKLTYDKNKVYRDEGGKVPYYFNDGLWLGYDDQLSLTEKAKYAAEIGIGVFVSDLTYDDYNGTSCGSGKYPLLRAVFSGCNF